jgi:hypothetical protein
MKECEIGGIIGHSNGYGFKVTFGTIKQARYYKGLLEYALKEDDYKIKNNKGYHDIKNENNLTRHF